MNLFKLLILFFIFICRCSWADPIDIFCPTPAEIREGDFHSWLPLYKEGEELASNIDVIKFRSHVQKFEFARWDTTYLESAHCFYSGDDGILEKITFARDSWRPFSTENWNWV